MSQYLSITAPALAYMRENAQRDIAAGVPLSQAFAQSTAGGYTDPRTGRISPEALKMTRQNDYIQSLQKKWQDINPNLLNQAYQKLIYPGR